jgi:large subunit ribosomal protein L13
MATEADADRKWFVVDAEDKILGRLAAELARRLRGKHKAVFTPHADTGDFVVVVNAGKVRLTGRKMDQKKYYRYSGFIGGMKEKTARQQLTDKPEEAIRRAVWGMLPKNSLGRRQIKKLKVYPGPDHPHKAQQPEPLEI